MIVGRRNIYNMSKEKYIRKVRYNVSPAYEGKQLRDVLSSIGYSRNLLQYLKNVQNVRLDTIVHCGEEFSIEIVENEDSKNIVPVEMPLDIVFEDEDIIIINKEAGIPTHPSLNNHDNTLGNALCYYFKDRTFVYRPINRLDKGTSGLVIVAKNLLAASLISKNFSDNFIRRSYLGIVSGNIFSAFMNSPDTINSIRRQVDIEGVYTLNNLERFIKPKGTVNIPIKRMDDSLVKRVWAPDGEEARTIFYPLKYNRKNNTSLVRFILETGRTHQIRVHMLTAGFPIIGDFLYNPDFSLINRQALHASEIIFVHPITRKTMRFVARIPDDILKLI